MVPSSSERHGYTERRSSQSFCRVSERKFCDQEGLGHEENDADVNDDGGAVDLTENPAALRHWIVSGSEMARVIGEF